MDRHHTTRALNELIVSCCDAYEGYRTAAQRVLAPDLRRQLDGYALERGEFVEELAQAIRRAGGDAETHGTIRGALHRGWMQLTGASDEAVLAECLRGEAMSLRAYRAASVDSLPPETKRLVERQLNRIAEIHDWITKLIDAPG